MSERIIECPKCDGEGENEIGEMCHYCSGSGTVIDDGEDLWDDPYDDFFGDDAGMVE